MKISEWMQVMLEEIARKKAELEQSQVHDSEGGVEDPRPQPDARGAIPAP